MNAGKTDHEWTRIEARIDANQIQILPQRHRALRERTFIASLCKRSTSAEVLFLFACIRASIRVHSRLVFICVHLRFDFLRNERREMLRLYFALR